MALKYIPAEWQNDMRINPFHGTEFYINPRCRVIPALTSAGVSYVANTTLDNMRGTYRMQTGATTSLTYLYTLSQRFIVEGWFRPEFAYNVASDQVIFSAQNAAEFSIIYNATTDKIDMIQSPGTTISTPVFTSDANLQNWIYLRAWYDNTSKLAGFYVSWPGGTLVDTENVPGAGDFIPLNTISFFPTVAAELSYWVIHELDEALPTGEYKTYRGARQIMFDFNGHTTARERLPITEYVRSFGLSKSVESQMDGGAGANSATIRLKNLGGEFSDDQTDAFDPFNGYFNGAEKYLQNRSQVEIESTVESPPIPAGTLYMSESIYMSTSLYMQGPFVVQGSKVEPMFVGRTSAGAFSRSSPHQSYGEVLVYAEDTVSELGETKLAKASAFDTFDLSKPSAEATSLFHSIARLATKKEIKNYALNSSFENATIANSWTNSGMATFERSNTVAQFGTYSMKCIADGVGDSVSQIITFEGSDLIDVEDVFNLSAYVYQGTASTVWMKVEELTTGNVVIGSPSAYEVGTATGYFVKAQISRVIQNSTCTRIKITFYATGACTFYVDGVMLSRGVDSLDYFVVNANDGTSGVGSADSYASATYDTIGFSADAVAITHPYVLLPVGSTPWEALRKIGDASIARYIGMTPDGALALDVAYNGANAEEIGDVEDVSSLSVSLKSEGANAVKVHGSIVVKDTAPKLLWSAEAAGIFFTDIGSKVKHPIDDGDNLSIYGAETFDAAYSEGTS
jgi:hypothetical protein